jgi:hypothetical protein
MRQEWTQARVDKLARVCAGFSASGVYALPVQIRNALDAMTPIMMPITRMSTYMAMLTRMERTRLGCCGAGSVGVANTPETVSLSALV